MGRINQIAHLHCPQQHERDVIVLRRVPYKVIDIIQDGVQ
jgi:hypothetical protein